MKKRKLLSSTQHVIGTFLLICGAAIVTGCAGGSYGTGLIKASSSFGGSGGSSGSGLSYSTVQVHIRGKTGEPLKDIKIIVESNRTSDATGVTDSQGQAVADVVLAEGEPIVLRFFHNGVAAGNRVIKKWQEENGVVDLKFRMDESGRIR